MKHQSRTIALSLLLVFGSLWSAAAGQAAALPQDEPPIYVYFFWGDGCPHCAEAKPFLLDLAERYPQVRIESFEIYFDTDNQQFFLDMAAAHDFEPRVVPTIFIGDEIWSGFAGAMGTSIERGVKDCLATGCPDAGAGIAPGHEVLPATESAEPADTSPASQPESTPEGVVPQTTEQPTADLQVYLFWGDACPECEATQSHRETQSGLVQIGDASGDAALAYLRTLEQNHPGLAVQAYDVWLSDANVSTFEQIAAAFGVRPRGVPTLFVGERMWEGFDDQTKAELLDYIEQCLARGCSDLATTGLVTESTSTKADTTLSLPLLGVVDLNTHSLWVSTVLISLVDGFNPCSLWVLSILIALSLRTGSRKRTFAIGLIYITVTAGVYVLFIAGLFTVLTVAGSLGWIRVAVAVLAVFFALVNIKDYFWYRKGLTFTIADERKPGIYRRMRKVISAGDSFWALAAATAALGIGVSLVEFACTAGFPVLWTNLIASQDVALGTFVLLLLLYVLIYQIDELAIFGAAVLTLKSSRLEEKHGRTLKLLGGNLMLTLALVMLIDPSLMSDVKSSLLVFGIALAATVVALLVHRAVRPESIDRTQP